MFSSIELEKKRRKEEYVKNVSAQLRNEDASNRLSAYIEKRKRALEMRFAKTAAVQLSSRGPTLTISVPPLQSRPPPQSTAVTVPRPPVRRPHNPTPAKERPVVSMPVFGRPVEKKKAEVTRVIKVSLRSS
eukprot:ANDGO_01834.mRNA.1 hypothetical protein